MTRVIYLDAHSTTPVAPEVFEVMAPYFTDEFGNPSNRNHVLGRRAALAVEKARVQVAALINARPEDIVFTSGATESNNLAILGSAMASRNSGRGQHIVTSSVEHASVFETCQYLKSVGFDVTFVKPDRYGMTHPEAIEEALRPDTILVSVMFANNEVGTINPIDKIAKVCTQRAILFHCDAAQAIGRVPIDLAALPIDLLCVSGHKIYGPKGIGALYVRQGPSSTKIEALLHGGGQEIALRPGTLNVPGIVGLGAAAELSNRLFDAEERTRLLRDQLYRNIVGAIEGVSLNGHPTERLPNNLHLSFSKVEAQALMMEMEDVALSSMSACSQGVLRASRVLEEMGTPAKLLHASLRFGLTRYTSQEDIDSVTRSLVRAVRFLRSL